MSFELYKQRCWADRVFSFRKEHLIRARGQDGQMDVIPFDIRGRSAQVALDDEIHKQLSERGYARVLVLKSRKEGISTYVQNLAIRWCVTHPHSYAKTVAHEAGATDELFRIGRSVADGLDPAIFPRPVGKPGKRTLTWSNGARAECSTQGGSADTDRGKTFDFLHLSEIPSWETRRSETSASDVAQALLNTVPPRTGICVIESTAKGAHGLFYEMCMAAQNEVVGNDWKFLFFTWLHNEEYTWPAPTEEAQREDDAYHDHLLIALDSGDDAAFHSICDHYDYTAIERDRVAQYRLHPAQVRYWRYTLVSQCSGDQGRFDEEWPMSPELAFIASGSSVFSTTIVSQMRKKAKKGQQGSMGSGGFCGGHGAWLVFERPKPEHTYIISSDSAAGGHGKQDDFSCVQVFDRLTREQVAEFYAKVPPDKLAYEVNWAACYYNDGVCAPEIEGPGLLTVHTLAKEFPERNIYRRFSEPGKVGYAETRSLGFSTNAGTRHYMFGLFESAIRTSRVVVHSPHLLQEMTHLRRNPRTSKPEAAPGYHDDAALAFCVALAVDAQMAEQGIPVEKKKEESFGPPPGIHEAFSGKDRIDHEEKEDLTWF